jgi:hypothetical protein
MRLIARIECSSQDFTMLHRISEGWLVEAESWRVPVTVAYIMSLGD